MNAQPTRDQLRALANAATEGPWRIEYDNEDDYEQGIAYGPFPSSLHGPESLTKWDDPRWQAEYGHQVSEVSDMRAEDAEFIAAARTAVPQLLDQLDRAEHRIARLEAQTSIRGRAVVMYRERARKAEARVRAARANHRDLYESMSGVPYCDECDRAWPCPTFRALEGWRHDT